jgi:hypothetical protein
MEMSVSFTFRLLHPREIKFLVPTGEDNSKMNLREIGWGSMDWIELAQDRDHWRALMNTVMNFRVP